MKKEDKQKLIKLLKEYKRHLWNNCNPECNNLPYELALLELEDMIDYLIREIKNDLK